MTQPTFDPLNPPNMGLGMRAGMFAGAMTCPKCGFATSDVELYECPGCNMVWRQRPKTVVSVEGPQAGESVKLECIFCSYGPEEGEMVFAGGSDLAHKHCLNPPTAEPEPEPAALSDIPEGYLAVVGQSPAPKKRKKKNKVHVHNLNAQGHCGCGYDAP